MKTRIEVKAWANVASDGIAEIYISPIKAMQAGSVRDIAQCVPLTGFYEVEREPMRQESQTMIQSRYNADGNIAQLIFLDEKFAGKKVTIVVTEME